MIGLDADEIFSDGGSEDDEKREAEESASVGETPEPGETRESDGKTEVWDPERGWVPLNEDIAVAESALTDHAIYIVAKHLDDRKGGHALVAIQEPGSAPTTYGFWPDRDVEFNAKGAMKTVPGDLRTNDTADRRDFDKALAGEDNYSFARTAINESQYGAALREIRSYEGRTYNGIRRNCTHFVIDVADAAGVDLPWAGVVPRPSVLQPSLE